MKVATGPVRFWRHSAEAQVQFNETAMQLHKKRLSFYASAA